MRKGKAKRARKSSFPSQNAIGTEVRAFRKKGNWCFFVMNSVYSNLRSQYDSAFLCVHTGGEGDQQIIGELSSIGFELEFVCRNLVGSLDH